MVMDPRSPKPLVGTVSPSLTPVGRRLLSVAEDVSRERFRAVRSSDEPSSLSEFVQIYREWITNSRGEAGTQREKADAWQLVCHSMITATNVDGALQLLIRFGKVVWGERGAAQLQLEDDMAALVFHEPWRAGPEGLMAAIWPLALTLCTLEFLTNSTFHRASGQVSHARVLSEEITGLLFAAPLRFEQPRLALVFPILHLNRPIIARPADLDAFFKKLLPLSLGARPQPPSIRSMVAGLIREDKLGATFRHTTLESIAARLGMSVPTLGRRLKKEGTTFRAIKEDIYTALAKNWLIQETHSVEEVAQLLGFSDGFAFRRFFKRTSLMSPAEFRRRSLHFSTDQ